MAKQEGIVKYACIPHEAVGMRGHSLSMGLSQAGHPMAVGDTLTIGGGLGLVGVLVDIFVYGVRDKSQRRLISSAFQTVLSRLSRLSEVSQRWTERSTRNRSETFELAAGDTT